MAATYDRNVPAYVETGRIIDVDIETYRVSVVTQYTQKPLVGLSFATPYQHFVNGEGIYFMPEVGSVCWVCFPSDGSRPFVMSWAPAREDNDSLRSNKMSLNPGDIYLGTRDENFLILRRGGVVQVGGGPLCQRMFIPITNIIQDFCENYGLHSLGGDLEWTIDREETTTDGKRPAHFRVKAREFANDAAPIAVLEIGSHTDNPANILSLVINASGQEGAAKKISLEFRKDGTASWSFSGNVDWTVTENITIHAEKNFSLIADQLAKLQGANVEIDAKSGQITLKAATNVAVSPRLTVAQGVIPGMLAAPSFLLWLATHGHPALNAPPSTQPPGTDHISKTIFGK